MIPFFFSGSKWIMMGMTATKDLAFKLEKECRETSDMQNITNNVNLLIEQINKSMLELMQSETIISFTNN